MDFGAVGQINGYYPSDIYRKNDSAKSADSKSFLSAVFAQSAEKTGGISFQEMLKAKYSKVFYNVMDTSKINHALWGRNDYPWDAYFTEPADESVLSWRPTGPEPDMQSPQVHNKINAMLGKVAIVVPPELEEKMKNSPELAQQIMMHIDSFILENEASQPGTLKGYVITLDENGNFNNACVVGEGRFTVSSSEFVEERKAREARHAEFERIAEENAMRRKLQQQAIEHKIQQSDMAAENLINEIQ